MSLVKAEEDLKKKGMLDRVIHLAASTATVAEAAEALGVEPGMIAKTLSFLQEEKPEPQRSTTGNTKIPSISKPK